MPMDHDHEIMNQHFVKSKGADTDAGDLFQHKICWSSSESSMDSRDFEKDDFPVSLDESTPANLVTNEVVLASDACDCNHRHEPSGLSPSNPPVVQSENYDPNRIPPSIFTSKPTTPLEWSVASNESLFSIHVGTNSFSKDIRLLYKSGELPQTNNYPPGLFPVIEAGAEKISLDISERSKLTEEKFPEPATILGHESPVSATKAVSNETKFAETITHEHIHPAEEVRHSTSSIHSFHFPLLESNIGGNDLVKVVMENMISKRQLSQAQIRSPVRPRKAFGSSWFSCFSCCSLDYSREL